MSSENSNGTVKRKPQNATPKHRREQYKKSFDKEESREKRVQSVISLRKKKNQDTLFKRRIKRSQKNDIDDDNDDINNKEYEHDILIEKIQSLFTKFKNATEEEEIVTIIIEINEYLTMPGNDRFVDMIFKYDIDECVCKVMLTDNIDLETLYATLMFYMNMTFLDHFNVEKLMFKQPNLYKILIAILEKSKIGEVPFEIYNVVLFIIGNLVGDCDNYRSQLIDGGLFEFLLDDNNFIAHLNDTTIEEITSLRTWILNACFSPLVHYSIEENDEIVDCSGVSIEIIKGVMEKLFSWAELESIQVRSNIVMFIKLVTDFGAKKTEQLYDDRIVDLLSKFLTESTDHEMKENIIRVYSNLCKCDNVEICERICETHVMTLCMQYLANFVKTCTNPVIVEILFMLSNLVNSTYNVIVALNARGLYLVISEIFRCSSVTNRVKREILYIYLHTMEICKVDLFKDIFTHQIIDEMSTFCCNKTAVDQRAINLFLNNINERIENESLRKLFKTQKIFEMLTYLQDNNDNDKIYAKAIFLLDNGFSNHDVSEDDDDNASQFEQNENFFLNLNNFTSF